MWWLAFVVLGVALVAAYLTWTVSRVERLHARADDAEAALVIKLDMRAETALDLAQRARASLGRHSDALRAAARGALDARAGERESAENDLTRILRQVPLPADDPRLREVHRAGRRVGIARQVHSDVVRDALRARHGRLARLMRVGRRLPRPAYFDIDAG